mgnify:CR=1 FL=1
MLVLSRRLMESICIQDDVVVTVLSIQGNKVQLGIQAPREMPVHRREVYDFTVSIISACLTFWEARRCGFYNGSNEHIPCAW